MENNEKWEHGQNDISPTSNGEGDGQHDQEMQSGQEHNGATADEQPQRRSGGGRQFNESEQHRKLFIGGLSFKTDEESLKTFFSQYGEVVDCVVMRDGETKRPRGFGFITFAAVTQVDEAQKHRPHVIDGKAVETKRAMPKEESDRPDSHVTTKRMWVGGVPEGCDDKKLRECFSQFGGVQSVEIVSDKTGRSRGFAFVTFDDYDSVDKAILGRPHTVAGSSRPLEVRKALSRAEMDQFRGGRGRGDAHHRGAPSYGAPYGGAPPGAYAYPSYGGSYGYYPAPGGKSRGGRGQPYGGSPYGSYMPPGYAPPASYAPPYGAYSADYGGYDYGRNWGGSSHDSAGRGSSAWSGSDGGASFGTGYSQYDAGGPMRGSSQYSQRSSGPYGGEPAGYSGGYGGGYGSGARR